MKNINGSATRARATAEHPELAECSKRSHLAVSPSLESNAPQRQNLGPVAQEASAELDDAVGDRVEVSSLPDTKVLEELLEALDEAFSLLAGVVVGLA